MFLSKLLQGQSCYNANFTRQVIVDSLCTLTKSCLDLENQIININSTLTACCSTIQNDFDTTFSLLEDLKISLTECCTDLHDTITNLKFYTYFDFKDIFTALEELNSLCSATTISTATSLSTPGIYCLENDIIGTITINSDDVVLDLNGHTVSGGGGVSIQQDNHRIVVKNGFIKNTTNQGVHLRTGCGEVVLQDLQIVNAGSSAYAIQLNSCNNCVLSRCTISQCYNGIALSSTNNTILQWVQVLNCSGIRGISSNGGSRNQAFNCRVADFTTADASLYGYNLATDALLVNCVAQGLTGSSVSVSGFYLTNSVLQNCSAQAIQSGSNSAFGFNMAGSGTNYLQNCVAEGILGATTSAGHYLNSNLNVLRNCKALNITSAGTVSLGFAIPGNDNVLEQCFAVTVKGGSSQSDGFFDYGTGLRNMIDSCVALDCTTYGFNITESGNQNRLTYNIAYNSGTNYSAGVIVTQLAAASPVLAGTNIDA